MAKLLVVIMLSSLWLLCGGCLGTDNGSATGEVQEKKSDTEQAIERAKLRKEIYTALLEILEESKKEAAKRPKTSQPIPAHPDTPTPTAKENIVRAEATSAAAKYFWHDAYHNDPHDVKCQDLKWHPYLKPAGYGGDPGKYEMVDALAEEIDVSTYLDDLKKVYYETIRTFCASCHSPARTLHQNYTPKQWQSSLVMLRARYAPLGFTKEMEEHLYEFFVYYEERKLMDEEEAGPKTPTPLAIASTEANKPTVTETPAPVEKESSGERYFWHDAYHTEPHDAKCQELKWHPYLKPIGYGGDPARYEMVDAMAEEIDVSTYLDEHKEIYYDIIRKFCASCHSPARTLHQNYTPKQWQSSLVMLRSRYAKLGFDKAMEDRLYEFFVYYEERKLMEEEQPTVAKTTPLPTKEPPAPVNEQPPIAKETKPGDQEVVGEKYFWHNAYHNEPHDAKCRDLTWHLYYKPNAGFGGDPVKYETSDSQAEEIDVAGYPEEFRKTYHNVIRTFCASCHTPARTLHQHYTPKQWKSSLVMLRSRYANLGFNATMEEQLYKFFVYYEAQQLEKEEQ